MRKVRALQNWLVLLRFNRENPQVARTIRKVENSNLSYLSLEELCDLARVALKNERQNVDGIIVQAGCALGGSAIVLASAKNKIRPLCIYDVFGMIPPPSDKDGPDVHARYAIISSGKSEGMGGNLYYGYEKDVYTSVLQNFANFGLDLKEHHVSFVKGLFQDTMRINGHVSLAHIDCDWYESVMTSLIRIEPHLVQGGTLVIDDYYNWSGCKSAVDEYFRTKKQEYIFAKKHVLHVVRK